MHHVDRIERIAEQVSLVCCIVAIPHIDIVKVAAPVHYGMTGIGIVLVS